ncbi:LacI family DNA-binding transcriptional regulator [Zhihengliuella flava]|uniref:DNA-binding LacI/PurR family transcriptional regulator n=1 Tax=Zhihengliuella flava TaxID=1285193 RepID=A0A931GEU9_9MICC|nr:LacI family DNA-binding transcriptional regulator [Zhihengliuella flava]MBG6083957.1 DNA-binding LacI/PurR family transcriptional regulator [Zhihengliuella flava]
MSSRPTIRDVAAAAGVSRGTVSRVLNGGHHVSAVARERIEAAMAATGYAANHHARSLATGRSGSVAFLITEPQHLLFADPTYARMLRGVTAALAEREVTLVLLMASNAPERARTLDYARAGHVDGAIVVAPREDDPFPAELAAAGIPTVCSGVESAAGLSTVSVREQEPVYDVVAHLRARGRRRIAHLAGPANAPGGRLRRQAFVEAVGEVADPRLVAVGDFTRASGAAAMSQVLERNARPELTPDAVFAASDEMAAGALTVLRQRGFGVPDQVSLVGFDDSGLAETLDPPLTTVAQPWDELSQALADAVVDLVGGAPPRDVLLEAELVVRRSS